METINPQALGAPRGYSNGMLASTGSRMLFIAGQIAWNSQQVLVSDGFAEQFAQALDNVLAVVRAAGGEPEHLAQLTLYVTDKSEYIAELKAVGATYRNRMGKHFPTMALVEVSGLLEPRAKVEIQGVAALPGKTEKPERVEEDGAA
ncbi:MAG: RidA family protein [Deltaproteobacteria bacterium]|nr:RidA family protein [Deltaproteobacteria bacterium]